MQASLTGALLGLLLLHLRLPWPRHKPLEPSRPGAAGQMPARRQLLCPELRRPRRFRPGPRFLCGGRTYDGHDGTDIRLPDLQIQQGNVDVLAAAPGRVVATRDGVEDVSIRVTGKAAVAGKECGNGVVIEHEGDWRSQYCHLARGSIRVKVGDRVVTGQSIGLVGLSGATEFPPLHFSLRHQGQIVDPFAHGAPPVPAAGDNSFGPVPSGSKPNTGRAKF